MAIPTQTHFEYSDRKQYVEMVLKAFHRDLPFLLKHMHGSVPDSNGFIDMGIDVEPGTTWLVRWSAKRQRIVRLWNHEKIERASPEEVWLVMELGVPAYIDPYKAKKKVPALEDHT